MRVSTPTITIAVLTVAVAGCGNPGEQESREASEALRPALELYSQNELDTALSLFQLAVVSHPSDVDSHVWVAETARRLRRFGLVKEATEAALAIDPCNSFAHTVLGDAYRPELSGWEETDPTQSWTHYMRAVECNPEDGNPWIGIWSGAMNRGDHAMEERALRQLVETDFLTSSVLEFNRWVLRSLPRDAILITNGDWDTFPALALQVVEDMRSDVALVNRSLLNLPWYAELMSERHGMGLPMSSTEMRSFQPFREADGTVVAVADATIRGWMDSGDILSGRPLVFAATVDMSAFHKPARIQFAGAHWRLAAEADTRDVDAASVRIAMEAVSGADFSTPEVSQQDRSAIRRLAALNRGLARTVLYMGYRCAEALSQSGDVAAAAEAAEWAERFANDAGLEGDQRGVVERIKEMVQGAAR
jgi:tetratricopeptide (TPR) repeat protein